MKISASPLCSLRLCGEQLLQMRSVEKLNNFNQQFTQQKQRFGEQDDTIVR
jgi:hypothetical protein